MQRWDFNILWQAGHAVWLGHDPYSVEHFYYPLPAAYLFALLATVPQSTAFWAWLLLNMGLLAWKLRGRLPAWALYFPLLHFCSSGQVDLMLWLWGTSMSRGWLSALAAAVITLKPQVAFIMLPWILLRWLRTGRRTLALWFAITTLLWIGPLAVDPTWVRRWQAAIPAQTALSRGNTPGIWSLEPVFPGIGPVLLIASTAIFVWGLHQERSVGWAAAALANPVGMFYDLLALMGAAPAWLLVPMSWVAVALSVWLRTFVPWMLVPVGVIIYKRRDVLWGMIHAASMKRNWRRQ